MVQLELDIQLDIQLYIQLDINLEIDLEINLDVDFDIRVLLAGRLRKSSVRRWGARTPIGARRFFF